MWFLSNIILLALLHYTKFAKCLNDNSLPVTKSYRFPHNKFSKSKDSIEVQRTIGGIPAKPERWRSLAVVSTGPIAVCVGSLVKANWVLTAAHCLDQSRNKYMVQLGLWASFGVQELLINSTVDLIDWSNPMNMENISVDHNVTVVNGGIRVPVKEKFIHLGKAFLFHTT